MKYRPQQCNLSDYHDKVLGWRTMKSGSLRRIVHAKNRNNSRTFVY